MNKPTIRATLGAPDPKREAQQPPTPMVGAGSLIVTHKGELTEAITVRTYYAARGTGMQPVRACIWVKPADRSLQWFTGRGSAGGCGYHKESAAIAEAVGAAGITLYGVLYPRHDTGRIDYTKLVHFGGTGSSGYPDIFKAIARAAGYRGRTIWISHGL